MTIEELKTEAKMQGYNLIKIQEREKLLPCNCGCNRRRLWSGWYGYDNFQSYHYECVHCGKESPRGKTKKDARHLWNEMIKGETRNDD